MEYPKAFNCLTRVQFHSNQGRSNDLDERVQGKFLKGSFLGSKMDSFFGQLYSFFDFFRHFFTFIQSVYQLLIIQYVFRFEITV